MGSQANDGLLGSPAIDFNQWNILKNGSLEVLRKIEDPCIYMDKGFGSDLTKKCLSFSDFGSNILQDIKGNKFNQCGIKLIGLLDDSSTLSYPYTYSDICHRESEVSLGTDDDNNSSDAFPSTRVCMMNTSEIDDELDETPMYGFRNIIIPEFAPPRRSG
jgi:hypothetical protein